MASRIDEVAGRAPGLRERKKHELRRRLSETATAMFLEHGFDNVRVSDIADACDVSSKTIYNYFPTKESLLFDRGESLAACLQSASEQSLDVLDAVHDLIADDVARLAGAARGRSTARDSDAIATVKAFAGLVASKQTLRGAVAEQADRLTQLAAQAIAAQYGTAPDDPENQIAASALVSLWQIELRSLLRVADTSRPLRRVRTDVLDDVERAMRLVRSLFDALPTTEQKDRTATGVQRTRRRPDA